MDFNQQPLKIAGFVHVKLKVEKQEIERARIPAEVTGRTLVGHDWLAALQSQFKHSNQIAASECNSMISSHLIKGGHSSEVNSIIRNDVISAFPRLFTRQRKVFGHLIKIKLKSEIKITSQKGRRISRQLQEAVQIEIERLLHEKHVDKVRLVNEKCLFNQQQLQ